MNRFALHSCHGMLFSFFVSLQVWFLHQTQVLSRIFSITFLSEGGHFTRVLQYSSTCFCFVLCYSFMCQWFLSLSLFLDPHGLLPGLQLIKSLNLGQWLVIFVLCDFVSPCPLPALVWVEVFLCHLAWLCDQVPGELAGRFFCLFSFWHEQLEMINCYYQLPAQWDHLSFFGGWISVWITKTS